MLAPTLKRGDIVVMDKVSLHKVPGVREAIVACGATVPRLPPYSPDLNPIEQLFGKIKALLHKAAVRSVDSLRKAIASSLKRCSPSDCAAFLAHAGYSQPNRKTL
jgi:transposase